ncbi:MAG: hypothetical protein OXK82_11955 [Deltaproteobacteria bacterium]|nr:plasmid stabilization protein [Rhodospirillaceae bacterium]MDE0343856.1 hypothetical protein [Deltaproteobacteria bacterium]
MATINVRLLADDVVNDLKLRAARNNRSLEGEVRHILMDAVKDDLSAKRAAFLSRTAKLRFASEGRTQTPAELLIREDRDHGH